MPNTAKQRKSGFEKQMQAIARDFHKEHGVEAINLDEVYEWAVNNGRYELPPPDPRTQFKRFMSRALAREKLIDPQGREVRKNHAFRIDNGGGQFEWEWAPIETINPGHMRISLTLRRDAMVAVAKQHKLDTESFNDNNIHGAQLSLFDYNLGIDLEESEKPEVWPEDAPDDGAET